MGSKKKRIKKSTLRVKLILLGCLCVIMIPLILGYVVVHGKTPSVTEQPSSSAETISQQSEPVSETESAAEPAASAETTTAKSNSKKQAIIVSPADADNWFLSIINIQYKLPDGYAPALAAAVSGSSVELDARVAPYYQEMYNAAKADGCVLTPYSGYRSYSLQESNYERKVNYYVSQGLSAEEAAAKTCERIFPAGCSEHNAGLSMDIVSASSDFVNTKEYQWLLDNAYKYGFVLRYPENKSTITGIISEPWHWRYVGAAAAKEMKENNQCLEEYLGLVQQ